MRPHPAASAGICGAVAQAIEPSLDAMGYALVQVKLGDSGGRRTLSVMAERKDNAPMGVEDCTAISHQASALLDVEDPIEGAYDLEVCSPGIERPLTKPADYARFTGEEAKVELMAAVNGQRKFRGVIGGIKGEVVTLKMPEGGMDMDIAFYAIRQAKLVVSEGIFKKNASRESRGSSRGKNTRLATRDSDH
ncbi:MAG: ribosome maturation factor RimP [Pseudomonadota bacterium]|nr:ribosome maturation factor RimP [Pseudomonadota bacterium]MDE3038310.1 ribosome maturation factor RimP [Pseudomonadota bacterium]